MNFPLIGQFKLTHRQESVFKSSPIGSSGDQHNKLHSPLKPSRGRTVLNSERKYDHAADLRAFQNVSKLYDVPADQTPKQELVDNDNLDINMNIEIVQAILSDSYHFESLLFRLNAEGNETKASVLNVIFNLGGEEKHGEALLYLSSIDLAQQLKKQSNP